MSSVKTFAVILFLVSSCGSVKSDVDIITRLCRNESCYNLDHDDPRYDSRIYYEQLFKIFSSGISQLIYLNVDQVIPPLDISSSCKGAFESVSKAFDAGDEWAFRREYHFSSHPVLKCLTHVVFTSSG